VTVAPRAPAVFHRYGGIFNRLSGGLAILTRFPSKEQSAGDPAGLYLTCLPTMFALSNLFRWLYRAFVAGHGQSAALIL